MRQTVYDRSLRPKITNSKSTSRGQDVHRVREFLQTHRDTLVLTGAGVSTESGIPDYRDQNGEWKRKTPIYHQEFIDDYQVRQRYWARSMLGWRYFNCAKPATAHYALAKLESVGVIKAIITQNVDGLHQIAGSRNVVDLHGRIDQLMCLGCNKESSRSDFQDILEKTNNKFMRLASTMAPDGDVDLKLEEFGDFNIPDCNWCGGVLMPNLVFYGGTVPKDRVNRAFRALDEAQALLIVGSSLMVYSGYRFCQHAAALNKPIVAINLGVTRADPFLTYKLEMNCGAALDTIAQQL